MHTRKLLGERGRTPPQRTRRELWVLWAACCCLDWCLANEVAVPRGVERDLNQFTPEERDTMMAFALQGGVLYTTSERSQLWSCRRAVMDDDPGPWYEKAYREFEDVRAEEGEVPCEGSQPCCWP